MKVVMGWRWKCSSSFKRLRVFFCCWFVVVCLVVFSLLSGLVNWENENLVSHLPWWYLDMVEMTDNLSVPSYLLHITSFCLCFPRHLAAFASSLSVQHPVLSLGQDVSHSDSVVGAFCPEVLGGCRCFSWAAARRLWMFMSLGIPHQMLFYTEWAWLWMADWLNQ